LGNTSGRRVFDINNEAQDEEVEETIEETSASKESLGNRMQINQSVVEDEDGSSNSNS